MANKGFFSNISGNVFGGITAGVVALPLALAFGVQSGLGPSAGLYGAIVLGFLASIFGGTPTQISGPTAPMTAVSMVIIAGIIATHEGDVQKALPYILVVFLLAGLMQILLGLSGVGRNIRYIPYPVVSGFMTAIGVIILITQLLPLVGYYSQNDLELIDRFKPRAEAELLDKILRDEAGEGILVLEDFRETVSRAERITEEEVLVEARSLAKAQSSGVVGALGTLPRAIGRTNLLELFIALTTIAIIYLFKRITTAIPSTLVALLAVSGAAYFLNLDYRPIEAIPAGIPLPVLGIFSAFSFDELSPYVFTAFTLAFLGAIDSLLTSVVADNMTKTKHNPNRELIGQGIGNSFAAVFGGLPGAGATIRTVVNIKAGATSGLSGIVAAIVLLLTLLVLGPVASQIPAAVLAGILITVGFGVMDYKGLKAIPKMQRSEVAVMIVVLLLSIFWNLVYAVGVGLVMAALIFMKKMGDLTASHSKVVKLDYADELNMAWNDEGDFPQYLKEEVFVKRLEGPLFFGYTADFQQLSKEIPDSARHIIIRMEKVLYVDQSGLYAMEEVLLDLHQRGIEPIFENLAPQPRMMMEKIDIIPDLVPRERILQNFREAIAYIRSNVADTMSR